MRRSHGDSEQQDPDEHTERSLLLQNQPDSTLSDVENRSDNGRRTKSSFPNRRQLLLKISFLLLGDFLANVDDTFLIAVYSQIAAGFSSSDRGAWIIMSESLSFSIFLPIYGFLGDKYGSKRPILASYILFVGGSLITSLAPTFWLLILGRVVAGVASAGMYSMTAIVIVEHADPSDIGVLRSYASAVAILGRNIGPVIGGFLTDGIGWRKALLCEIPIAVLSFITVGWFFGAQTNDGESDQNSETEVDFPGIAFFALTVMSFVLAVSHLESDRDRGNTLLIASVAIFFVSGGLLLWREHNIGDKAFIPLTMFNRRLGVQYVIQVLWLMVHFSLIINIPTYFSRIENAKASTTGLHLLPLSASNILGNLSAGRLIKIWKRYKLIAHMGVALGSICFVLLAFQWRGSINTGQSLLVMLSGFGSGMLNASTFVAISLENEDNRRGAVVGTFFLAQELGALIGVSGSSTLVRSFFEHALQKNAPEVRNKTDIIHEILQDSSFAFTLSAQWQKVAIRSFVQAFQIFCFVGAALLIAMQPLLLAIREKMLL